MRSVELFSGCGGLALGLARAGFKHDLLVELNGDAFATLELNKKRRIAHIRDWNLLNADVKGVGWSELDLVPDVVAGGPPCQPFSIGGKHRGHTDDRDMWPEAARALGELKPRAFIFENVRGLTRPAFGEYLRWIKAALERPNHGRQSGEGFEQHLSRLEKINSDPLYDVRVEIVDAADFGAPQRRHRVVVVGVRRDLGVSLPDLKRTHSRDRLLWDQWVTGAYWERHGLPRPSSIPANRQDARTVQRLATVLLEPDGEAWVTVRDALASLGEPNGVDGHVFQDGAKVYPGHTGSPLDSPAKALKAGDHGVPGGENMMVRDDGTVRYFTIREAARLQGLPDDWLFATSWSESMRQLGNAVPSQLSQALGEWVGRTLGRASVQTSKAA
ncbi:DNA (cytosine-5-)-methyltransferase [Thalassobaculum sp.]|uniref:DNA cytosine methyltransferase n=1 Tax=Thalassobaculum sp. TaxID=2022740 RepID=UPI0032ED29D3